jgi:hypothetical protein
MRETLYSNRLLALIVLAIVVIAGFTLLNFRPQAQPVLECYEDQTPTMTIQEVADLMGTSLVELSWIPENWDVVPQITTYAQYVENYPHLY